MELEQQFLTENDCYQAGRTIVPQGIMVHSTGVAQPDPQVFVTRWNQPDVAKCVHAFVGREQIIQTLPWTMRGWHAGTGASGRSANNTHISFECCEPAGHTYQGGAMVGYDAEANQPYFDDLYQNAVQLTAMLCRQFSLDPLVLQWWPKHGVTMDQFRQDVAQAVKDGDSEEDGMTQERFNELMENWLAQRAQLEASSWSAPAREWAQEQGIVAGDGDGSYRYRAFTTREETVQMLYQLQKA